MKSYLILAAVLAAFVFGAYWAGGRIAAEHCKADAAARQQAGLAGLQNEIITTKEKINAETNNAAAAAVRSRLREMYTIGD
ncbi:MAG: hypothetical protein LBD50_03470 [Rickettsiales bacterium]|jgi:cell division protein FtsB|nr:hypothetical protein [Rickettsiales bacterium]